MFPKADFDDMIYVVEILQLTIMNFFVENVI